MTRGAFTRLGQFDAFPLGGQATRLVLNGKTWTEFDPKGADLVRLQTPGVPTTTRIVYTDTADHPDLVNGAPVTAGHLGLALEFYVDSSEDLCFDRSGEQIRFFFALADTASADETVAVLFKRAAS